MYDPIAAPNNVHINVVFRPNTSPNCVDTKPPEIFNVHIYFIFRDIYLESLPKIFAVARTIIEAFTLKTESDISKINAAYVA